MNLRIFLILSAVLLALSNVGRSQELRPAYGYNPYKSHYGPVYAANELNQLGGGGPQIHGLDYGFAVRSRGGIHANALTHRASHPRGALTYSGGYHYRGCAGYCQFGVPGGCCNPSHYREVAPGTFAPAAIEYRSRSWYSGELSSD